MEAMSVDLSTFNSLVQRLETVADRLEKTGGSGPADAASASGGSNDPAIVIAFDGFLKEKSPPLEAAASSLAVNDVNEATQFFFEAMRLLRGIFVATGKCCKPKDTDWGKFFGPVMELQQKAGKACDNRSDYFHHRKAAAEALGLVALVTQPGPAGHVQNVLESMDFHGIKVMQKKDPAQTAWINALKTFLKDLIPFCNDNIKMGVDWKVGGEDPVEYFAATPLGSAPAAGAPAAKAKGKGKGGAPPPPKGGFAAPPPPDADSKPKSAPGGGMAAVFDAINQFKDGTGGLKKVTDDMKTKNMKDRPAVEAPKPKPKAAAPRVAGRFAKGPKGDPMKVFNEQQNTWFVQNYEGAVTLEEADKAHVVRVTDCKNCTVKITNRVKAVAIDNCERVDLECSDVISAVECMNSDRIKMKTTGTVHLFCIDKCDGVNVWLNKASIAAEILCSKSSEMNVTIPDDKGDEYDTIEIPIPEQFKTTVTGRTCKTEVSELYSS